MWILAFSKLWDTFSYFGTQTILALYFIQIFHFSRNDSYLIYGAYAAFAYATPILGGIVADKWLGTRDAFIIGSTLNIVGNLVLMSFHQYLFCLGLSISLIGSGLYRGTSTHLVGTLYQDGDAKKEAGFTWLYLAINVGGMAGPLIYGIVAHALGWNYGFLFSAIGILISTVWFLSNWQVWNKDKQPESLKLSAKIFLYIAILLACLFLAIPFYITKIINPLIFLLFVGSIVYLVILVMKYTGIERRRLLALLLISFFAMFYFAAGLQIGTTITLFIQDKIQENVIITQLPASVFSTLYPLFVLVLAPFFTYLWSVLKSKGISISTPSKLAIGIMLATIGIGAFAFASLTNFVWTGIILGNLMLSAGELALTPAIYTAISDLSPIGMKSTMMGAWLLFVALGGYLSSLLASVSHFVTSVIPSHHSEYFSQFLFIAGFTFLIFLVLAASIPKLSRMMN